MAATSVQENGFHKAREAILLGLSTELKKSASSSSSIVGLTDETGCSLLHIACQQGSELDAVILMCFGADINMKNNNSQTCLDVLPKDSSEILRSRLLSFQSFLQGLNSWNTVRESFPRLCEACDDEETVGVEFLQHWSRNLGERSLALPERTIGFWKWLTTDPSEKKLKEEPKKKKRNRKKKVEEPTLDAESFSKIHLLHKLRERMVDGIIRDYEKLFLKGSPFHTQNGTDEPKKKIRKKAKIVKRK